MGAGGGSGRAAGGVPVQGPEGAVVRVAGVEGRRVVERPGQDRPVGEGALRGRRARPRRRAGRAAASQHGGAGRCRLAAGLLSLVRRGGDLGQRPELGLGEGRLLRRVDDGGAGGGGQQRVQEEAEVLTIFPWHPTFLRRRTFQPFDGREIRSLFQDSDVVHQFY